MLLFYVEMNHNKTGCFLDKGFDSTQKPKTTFCCCAIRTANQIREFTIYYVQLTGPARSLELFQCNNVVQVCDIPFQYEEENMFTNQTPSTSHSIINKTPSGWHSIYTKKSPKKFQLVYLSDLIRSILLNAFFFYSHYSYFMDKEKL